jgi:hypothetical protein
MTENVIFTYDGNYQPEWQYYSMPHSCVGGGDTIEAARASYHDALAFQLELSGANLPPIREHYEAEAYDGIYVRYAGGDKVRAAGAKVAASFLRSSTYDSRLQGVLHSSTTAGGYPVLVVVQPEDSVASVIDQMTDEDSLWLVTPIEAVPVALSGDKVPGIPLLGFLPIVGQHAEDADAPHIVELDREQIDRVTVHDLFQRYAHAGTMNLPQSTPTLAPRIKIPSMV